MLSRLKRSSLKQAQKLRLSNQLAIHDKTGLDNQSGFCMIGKEKLSRGNQLNQRPLFLNKRIPLPSKSNVPCARAQHCHQNQIQASPVQGRSTATKIKFKPPLCKGRWRSLLRRRGCLHTTVLQLFQIDYKQKQSPVMIAVLWHNSPFAQGGLTEDCNILP